LITKITRNGINGAMFVTGIFKKNGEAAGSHDTTTVPPLHHFPPSFLSLSSSTKDFSFSFSFYYFDR